MMPWRSFLITTTRDIFGQVEMTVRGSLTEMQEQHPQNVERCQYNFAQKDQIDREKMAKQATKNIDMDLEL